MYRRSFIALVAGAVALLDATALHAHAIVLKSSPAAGQTVSGSAIVLRIRFNSRVDAKRSRLQLAPPAGKVRTLEIQSSDRPDELVAEIGDLGPGRYRLRWQVLAVDGHITHGEIAFQVAGA